MPNPLRRALSSLDFRLRTAGADISDWLSSLQGTTPPARAVGQRQALAGPGRLPAMAGVATVRPTAGTGLPGPFRPIPVTGGRGVMTPIPVARPRTTPSRISDVMMPAGRMPTVADIRQAQANAFFPPQQAMSVEQALPAVPTPAGEELPAFSGLTSPALLAAGALDPEAAAAVVMGPRARQPGILPSVLRRAERLWAQGQADAGEEVARMRAAAPSGEPLYGGDTVETAMARARSPFGMNLNERLVMRGSQGMPAYRFPAGGNLRSPEEIQAAGIAQLDERARMAAARGAQLRAAMGVAPPPAGTEFGGLVGPESRTLVPEDVLAQPAPPRPVQNVPFGASISDTALAEQIRGRGKELRAATEERRLARMEARRQAEPAAQERPVVNPQLAGAVLRSALSGNPRAMQVLGMMSQQAEAERGRRAVREEGLAERGARAEIAEAGRRTAEKISRREQRAATERMKMEQAGLGERAQVEERQRTASDLIRGMGPMLADPATRPFAQQVMRDFGVEPPGMADAGGGGGSRIPMPPETTNQLAQQVISILEDNPPESLDEIESVASAYGLTADDISRRMPRSARGYLRSKWMLGPWRGQPTGLGRILFGEGDPLAPSPGSAGETRERIRALLGLGP